ncbi:MAG: ankyrin repeat domain-containing protein [Woeseiaceae bacterium]|nr:ankyrin repeat domain-containing protein [Woeseiaceae bacterium]
MLLLIGGCATAPDRPHAQLDAQLHAVLDASAHPPPDISALETLLRSGANANARDTAGHSAIWKALDRKQHDIVLLLLDYGADPDTLDTLKVPSRATPLCHVISLGRYSGPSASALDVMRALLRAGAASGATCPGGLSALELAMDIGTDKSLNVLAVAGVRVQNEADLTAATRALVLAAQQSKDETLAALIELGADVNHRVPGSQRPLDAALTEGFQASTALLLLEAGATIGRADTVFTAVKRFNGDLPLLNALLAAGADPDGAGPHTQTGMRIAIQRGYLDVLQTLLVAGADPNQAASTLLHPLLLLFQVPQEGRLPIAELLIAAGADIESQRPDGTTVLMAAASSHDYAFVKLALESGANRDTKMSTGQTAADLAVARRASLKLLDLLSRSDEEKFKLYGRRLSGAVQFQSLGDLQGLIDEGIDLNLRGENNRTALEIAGRSDSRAIFQKLLDHGADPDVFVLDGSALQFANIYISATHLRRQRELGESADASIPLIASALLGGEIDLVERLLQAGADPNARTATGGDTALHLAHLRNTYLSQVTNLMLDGGADPNLTNDAGYTPATLAAKRRSIDVIRLLVDRGVDINATDGEGRTALSVTLEHGVSFRDKKALIELGAVPSASDVAAARRSGNQLLIRLISDARGQD